MEGSRWARRCRRRSRSWWPERVPRGWRPRRPSPATGWRRWSWSAGPARPSLPRATAVSTRSMELLRAGARGGGAGRGRRGRVARWSCDTLASASAGVALPLGAPTREQSALVSPAGPACVPQDHLEPVLLRHLRSPPVGARRGGRRGRAARQRPGGRPRPGARPRGGHRPAGGRALPGRGRRREERHPGALEIPMPARPTSRRRSRRCSAPRSGTSSARTATASTTSPAPAPAACCCPAARTTGGSTAPSAGPSWRAWSATGARPWRGCIRLATGLAGLRPRIERIGTFRFAAQVAERFRDGSAFLVATPPTG